MKGLKNLPKKMSQKLARSSKKPQTEINFPYGFSQHKPAKQFDFQLLPGDLKQKVVTFMSAGDTLHLTQACRSMRADVGISKDSSPFTERDDNNRNFRGPYETGDQPACFAAISPQAPDKIHSMTFQCSFVDQGWGNRKGEVYIVARDKPNFSESVDQHMMEETLKYLDFREDTVVAKSPVAKHKPTTLTLTFYPKPDKVYQLWCKVGGGGGHELHLRSMVLHCIRFNYLPETPMYTLFQYEPPDSYTIVRTRTPYAVR